MIPNPSSQQPRAWCLPREELSSWGSRSAYTPCLDLELIALEV